MALSHLWYSKQQFGTATEKVCPKAIIEVAQKAQEEKKNNRRSVVPPHRIPQSITPDEATMPLNQPPPAPPPNPTPQWGSLPPQTSNHHTIAAATFQPYGVPTMCQDIIFLNLYFDQHCAHLMHIFPSPHKHFSYDLIISQFMNRMN